MQAHASRDGARLVACSFGGWHYLDADKDGREAFCFDRHTVSDN